MRSRDSYSNGSEAAPPGLPWAVLGTVVLALLLRLYRLGEQNFWIDEIFSYIASHPVAPYSFLDYVKDDLHGVFYHVFIYGWSSFGDSEAWLRLPSAIAGTLSVLVLYFLGRELFSKKVGLVAAFLLAINPFHVYYSQSLRNYAFLILFVLVSYLAFVRASRKGGRGSFIVHGLSSSIAVLCNFSALFALAAQALTALLTGRLFRGDRIKGWIISFLIILVSTGYWGLRQAEVLKWDRLDDVQSVEVQEKLRGETTISGWSWPYTFYVFSVGNYLGPSLEELHHDPSPSLFLDHAMLVVPSLAAFAILLLAGIWELWRRGRHRLLFLFALLVPLLLTTFLARQNVKVFNPRYVLVALPFFLFLVVLGWELLRGYWRGALGLVVLAASFVALGNYYFNPRYQLEDVRGAAELLTYLPEAPDVIVAPTIDVVFLHYFRGSNPVFPVRLADHASREDAAAWLISRLADAESVWYVESRPWVNDPDGWIHETLESKWDKVSSQELPGVALHRYSTDIRRDLDYEIREQRESGEMGGELVVVPQDDPEQVLMRDEEP